MPIPANNVRSRGVSTYLKNTLLLILGLGSAGGITRGYLDLKSKIDVLEGNNINLTQKHDESEALKAGMAKDLQTASATIARLEQNAAANKSKTDRALADMSLKMEGLVQRDKEHDKDLTSLNKGLGIVTVKIAGLECKVTLSDLPGAYNTALASSVTIKTPVTYKDHDDMGNVVEKTKESLGSGVIAAHINNGKDGGYIITNWHNIQSDSLKKDEDYKDIDITIIFPNRSEVKAKPYYYKDKSGKEQLAKREDHDLVLLKIAEDISSTKPIPFSFNEPTTGTPVMVLGSPLTDAFGSSVTLGIVSGNDRLIRDNKKGEITFYFDDKPDAVKNTRTDAAINPGYSGGIGWGVLDKKMLFMPASVFYPKRAFHGIGFGIPAPTITSNIKSWIPSYELNKDGIFVEKIIKAEK